MEFFKVPDEPFKTFLFLLNLDLKYHSSFPIRCLWKSLTNPTGITRWVLCHHSTLSCLTAAGYMTGINCSWGFAIITPSMAIDSKYPIITAFVSMIVVCSLCVVISFPTGQTHPWKKISNKQQHDITYTSQHN